MSYNRMTSRDKIGICVRRMNSGEKNEELAFQENEFCCFSLWFIFFYFTKKVSWNWKSITFNLAKDNKKRWRSIFHEKDKGRHEFPNGIFFLEKRWYIFPHRISKCTWIEINVVNSWIYDNAIGITMFHLESCDDTRYGQF